ncbi:Hypothetical predicted protein [Octopus vulgaris]|uniref:Uncharacterized protein n=1 Tax=Octopus vulgaris TaxID=6645 RepID=A0AA36F130_OCTVU|nr:Hypothetical predicted protein [Octopus vulgaris]
MSRNWSARELQLFVRAWKIADDDSPNNIIAAAPKNNDFSRTTAQIERKKREFIRSYALIRQHVDALDIILGGDGTREGQKDEENIKDPTKDKTEKPRTQGNNDTFPAPNTTTEDQRGAMATRKEKHPKIDGKQEVKGKKIKAKTNPVQRKQKVPSKNYKGKEKKSANST